MVQDNSSIHARGASTSLVWWSRGTAKLFHRPGTDRATIDFVSMKKKIRVLERRIRAKKTDDPEGTLATLQSAKRLLAEGAGIGVYTALDAALEMSVPKDRSRTWWSAHHALNAALPNQVEQTMSEFLAAAQPEEIEALFDRAIKAQGELNLAVLKVRG